MVVHSFSKTNHGDVSSGLSFIAISVATQSSSFSNQIFKMIS